jgi:FMN-dependent NADH-azoreductase
MRVLHIDAGITPNSVSRQISAAVVEALKQRLPGVDVIRRDLEADPVAHLDGQALATLGQDEVMQEFLAADVVVIGAPMYNFGVASQLKAWLDRVLVAGKTFRYTAEGPEGLVGDKTVIVASSRGGIYAQGTPMAEMDFQERYLTTVFRFVGIEDVAFVRAEGVAISPDHRESAIAAALRTAPSVVADLAPALAA